MNARLAVALAAFAFGIAHAADKSSVAKDDRKFMEDAARAGLAEVDAAKMAKGKAESQSVKDFARRMEEDHAKANEELRQLAAAKGVSLPNDVDRVHKRKADELRNHDSAQFDREYMKQQVSDHKHVVAQFDREAKHGHDADVKQWAAGKLPALREHLQMAQAAGKGIAKESPSAPHQPKADSSGSMVK